MAASPPGFERHAPRPGGALEKKLAAERSTPEDEASDTEPPSPPDDTEPEPEPQVGSRLSGMLSEHGEAFMRDLAGELAEHQVRRLFARDGRFEKTLHDKLGMHREAFKGALAESLLELLP